MQEEKFMKTILVLVSCLALAPLAHGQDFNNRRAAKKAAKEQAATAQTQTTTQVVTPKGGNRVRTGVNAQLSTNAQLKTQRHLNRAPMRGNANALPAVQNGQGAKIRHFDLQRTNKVQAVKFRNENRIAGAERWRGDHYNAFRNYRSQWHDRDWWRHHHNRIVFVFGGWYYWNDSYWYPAWGYDSNAYYAYDGPIYAYNDLPPDQVIANVQASLQEQGYYEGEVDGELGPLTRAAIASYQQDHGLYVTSAIDQPTLSALGMS
jgi:hypothetical protein